MNRRNFIGNMLLAGAGFFVLPASRFENRIWVPDKRVVKETVRSIWCDYYLCRNSGEAPPKSRIEKMGTIIKERGRLWYGSPVGWILLQPLSTPIRWSQDKSRSVNEVDLERIMISRMKRGPLGDAPDYREGEPGREETVKLSEAINRNRQSGPLPIPEISAGLKILPLIINA